MMKKIITAAAVIILLITLNLHAAPQYSMESPQSDVTLGRFESDADYFNNVRNYADLDFGKWWGVVSYRRQNLESPQLAQIGFATRIGKVYTSLSYRGNGFLQFGKMTGINSNINVYREEIDMGRTWKVFDASPVLDTGYLIDGLRNEASLLLGLADMGFLLYYASNHQLNKQADYAIGPVGTRTYYKSFEEEYGHINPGITWGMTKELIPGKGVKPQVNIDLDFKRETQIVEEFADLTYTTTRGKRIDKGINYFGPGINLALYGFNLYTKNNFSLGMDLEYGIKMYFYSNDYSYQDLGALYKTKRIKNGYLENLTLAKEAFRIEQDLAPYIGASWQGERLGLVGRIGIPMALSKEDVAEFNILNDGIGTLVKAGDHDITRVYEIIPRLDLALQWAIVPSRLFLNTGAQLRVLLAQFQNKDRKRFIAGVEDKTYAYIDKQNQYGSAGTSLYIGLTFDITKNLQMQAAMGVDSGNNLNVFSSNFTAGAGGLINFGNILVALKF